MFTVLCWLRPQPYKHMHRLTCNATLLNLVQLYRICFTTLNLPLFFLLKIMRKINLHSDPHSRWKHSLCIPFTYSLYCIMCFFTDNAFLWRFRDKWPLCISSNGSDVKTEHRFFFHLLSFGLYCSNRHASFWVSCEQLGLLSFAFCYGRAHISICLCVQSVILIA